MRENSKGTKMPATAPAAQNNSSHYAPRPMSDVDLSGWSQMLTSLAAKAGTMLCDPSSAVTIYVGQTHISAFDRRTWKAHVIRI